MPAGYSQQDETPQWRRIANYPPVAMFIAIALFLIPLAIFFYIDPAYRSKSGLVNAAIVLSVQLLIYKTMIARLGEHPRNDLPIAGSAKNLSLGMLVGFLLMSAVVGVAAILDVYNIVGFGGTEQLLDLLIATAVVPGILEEIFFRGILFRWIEEWVGTWAGLILSSLAFGFAHYGNPNVTVLACLWIAVEAGLLLGGAYMLTRSLWMPIGLHMGWNFAQGFIYDVPVSGLDEQGLVQARLSGPDLLSGGAFGLEASLIAVVIATAAGVALILLAVRKGELMQPRWVRRRRAS